MESKFNKAVRAVVDHPSRTGERTIVFFDAVMAIAITLMALEIGIPEAEGFRVAQVHELFVPFTALCVSFVALGQLWYLHAQAYSSEAMVREASIPAHLWLMFFIVLFPKTTELIAAYPTSPYAIAIYLVCYVVLVIVEFSAILRSYRRQSRKFSRWAESNYGVTLDRETLTRVRAKSDLHNELVDALVNVLRAIIADIVLAVVTTFGAVFALFLCPVVCYVFFAIEIAGSAIVSHRSRGSWETIGAAWDRFDASSGDETCS